MAVDVDRQRMIITPVLRLVFALTSLVDTSDYMEVAFIPFSIFTTDIFR
jgi:nuclear pore complex protein Nup205